jgi:hypothetical protein
VFTQSAANPGGFPAGAAGDPLRRNVEAFMMAFDTNVAPIVGQQTTRSAATAAAADPRIDLLIQRANAGECDLVVKGRIAGEDRGLLYVGGGQFVTDRADDAPISDAVLRALANTAGQELTYTCVPLGSGVRIGIDRDHDSFGDRDELDGGSDPSNPASTPPGVAAVCTSLTAVTFRGATFADRTGKLSVRAELALGTYTQETISAVADDGGGQIFAGNVAGALILPKGHGFKYRAPKGATGISNIQLRQQSATQIYKVTLKTKKAWTPPAADETEATTHVTVNVGGKCFRGNATRVR